jgi:hypothetical protein
MLSLPITSLLTPCRIDLFAEMSLTQFGVSEDLGAAMRFGTTGSTNLKS